VKTKVSYKTIGQHVGPLSSEECKTLYEYLEKNAKLRENSCILQPWLYGGNVLIEDIKEQKVKDLVILANKKIANYLSLFYNTKLYPHFSDLVLWDCGCLMDRHIDDGADHLYMRHVSAVLYLNDNFLGGNTFIAVDGENSDDFISFPSTGNVISFYSNITNPHGVTEILEGKRGTLAMWFTKDPRWEMNT
jgi:hypothetical protein